MYVQDRTVVVFYHFVNSLCLSSAELTVIYRRFIQKVYLQLIMSAVNIDVSRNGLGAQCKPLNYLLSKQVKVLHLLHLVTRICHICSRRVQTIQTVNLSMFF